MTVHEDLEIQNSNNRLNNGCGNSNDECTFESTKILLSIFEYPSMYLDSWPPSSSALSSTGTVTSDLKSVTENERNTHKFSISTSKIWYEACKDH